jgi:ABC-type multidrug transport system fused ATPase/permease subunit
MYSITITAPTRVTTHQVDRELSIGRDGTDIVVEHVGVSRRHATIAPGDGYCVVADVGSSNGTFINDARIQVPTMARPGDVVRFGTEVTLTVSRSEPVRPQVAEPATPTAGTTPAAGTDAITRDGIEVRWIRRSAGRKAAKSMLDRARRARRKLAGFGSEATGQTVTIHLVDPIVRDGELITSGTVVDPASSQMWCVVSPEASPEDPTRAMALIFGAALPGAEALETLIAGYGLALAGNHDATPGDWTELDEPAQSQTAAAFVHHLIEQSDDETVREFLGAPATSIDASARRLFGKGTDQLVRSWIAADASDLKSTDFIRLAFRRLWPYKVRQAEVFVYMLLSLAFTSVYPFATRHLFDEVIPSEDFSRVWKLLLLLVAAFAVSLLASVRRSVQSSYISSAVVRDIRQEMFDRAQRLDSQAMSGYQQGEVLSRMFQDVGQLQSGLSAMINTGIFQFVSLIVSGAIMLSVNLWLGLLVCVSAPIIAIVYRQMGDGAQKRSMALQEDGAALMGVAAENYQAGPVVKIFRLEAHESARFSRASDKVIRSMQRLSLFSGLFGLSVNFIMTLLQMTVLGVGAWMIFEGNFTLGGLVAFLAVMGEFLGPVTDLTTLGQTMQQSMGSLKRVEEVTTAPMEPAGEDLPHLTPVARSIELRELSFSYTAERRTLDGLNVTIPAGSRTAFVGPSGSGKSTVLQALMRLIEPDEGAILVDGVDLRERALSSWRAQIGAVFQDPFLFDISLAENIALGGDGPTREQVAGAAAAAEIDSFLGQLPEGLDSAVGEGGSMLSGGQRQRAAIARTLVGDPGVLVLDEATSALDAATERAINDTIDRAGSGRTVISVTHRLTAITDYDLIVVLVDGRVESQGTHEELLAERGTYTQLWCEQTGAPMPDAPTVDVAASLAELAVFRGAAPGALEALVETGHVARLDTGTTATPQPGGLSVVLSGRAVMTGSTGEVREIGPGDVVGATALHSEAVGLATLEAREPVELLAFEPSALVPFVTAYRSSVHAVDVPEHARTLVRATIAREGGRGALHAGAARATIAMPAIPAMPAPTRPNIRSTVSVQAPRH